MLVGKESWIWTNPHCLLRFLRCAWTRLLQVPQDLGIQFHRTARPMVRTRETLSRRSRSCCYCSIRISRLAALELVRVQEDQASDAQLTSPSPFCKFSFYHPSILPHRFVRSLRQIRVGVRKQFIWIHLSLFIL